MIVTKFFPLGQKKHQFSRLVLKPKLPIHHKVITELPCETEN
jgi:hypothetical protein